VIALGGVARKSPFIMQVVSDVLNLKISVPKSEETCALGAAMCAAAACGIYPSIESARTAMESGFETEYLPNPVNARAYEALFDRYRSSAAFVEQETISSEEPVDEPVRPTQGNCLALQPGTPRVFLVIPHFRQCPACSTGAKASSRSNRAVSRFLNSVRGHCHR